MDPRIRIPHFQINPRRYYPGRFPAEFLADHRIEYHQQYPLHPGLHASAIILTISDQRIHPDLHHDIFQKYVIRQKVVHGDYHAGISYRNHRVHDNLEIYASYSVLIQL